MKQQFLIFCLLASTVVPPDALSGEVCGLGVCQQLPNHSSGGGSSSDSTARWREFWWGDSEDNSEADPHSDADYDQATQAIIAARDRKDWYELIRLHREYSAWPNNSWGTGGLDHLIPEAQAQIAYEKGNLHGALRLFRVQLTMVDTPKGVSTVQSWINYIESEIHAAASTKAQVQAEYDKANQAAATVLNNYSLARKSGTWNNRDLHEALRLFRIQQSLLDEPNVRETITNLEAVVAYDKGDWHESLRLYRMLKDSPNTRGSIADVEARIAYDKGDWHEALRLLGVAQSLIADRDRAHGGSIMRGRIADIEEKIANVKSSDTMVVDTHNVPSGLSKPIENAIASVYINSPPGVSGRVRKGFQAVASNDWKVANAWFEDAYKRDPGNVNLQRLIIATIGTPKGEGKIAVKHTFATLNANARTMETEEIMSHLMSILESTPWQSK